LQWLRRAKEVAAIVRKNLVKKMQNHGILAKNTTELRTSAKSQHLTKTTVSVISVIFYFP